MSQTVGDFLVERLEQWGVRHVFGYPSDGINGVFGALNRFWRKAVVPNISCVRLTSRNMWPALGKPLTGVGGTDADRRAKLFDLLSGGGVNLGRRRARAPTRRPG
jgi:hypothetical protein